MRYAQLGIPKTRYAQPGSAAISSELNSEESEPLARKFLMTKIKLNYYDVTCTPFSANACDEKLKIMSIKNIRKRTPMK